MSLDNRFYGWPNVYGDNAVRSTMPYGEVQAINTASGDVSISSAEGTTDIFNCRGISVDTTGIVKIDYSNDGNGGLVSTEVLVLEAGVVYPIRNVTKIYRYYTGSTPCTATVYDSTGSATQGLKLRR
jgi:hypothetical protein